MDQAILLEARKDMTTKQIEEDIHQILGAEIKLRKGNVRITRSEDGISWVRGSVIKDNTFIDGAKASVS